MRHIQNLGFLARPNGKPYTMRRSEDPKDPEEILTVGEWIEVIIDALPKQKLTLIDNLRARRVQNTCVKAEVGGAIALDDPEWEWLRSTFFDEERGKYLVPDFNGPFAMNLFNDFVGVALYELFDGLQPATLGLVREDQEEA